MKKLFIFKFLIILLLFNHLQVNANIKNKIIANIGEQIITSHELKNKIITNLILNNQEVNQINVNNNKPSALRSLINYKLKKNEIIRTKTSTNIQAVNDHLKKISSKYNTDIFGLEKIFRSNSLDYELYKDEIKTEFAWQKLVYQIYNKKIFLDDAQINDELNQYIKQQQNIKEFELAEIELQEEKENIEKKINEIKKEIELIGFENAAIKFSISTSNMDGGNLGWINISSLSADIAKKLSKMKIGEVSDPIIKSNSILILKLLDKREIKITQKNIEAMKNNIIVNKKNELLNLFANSHLTKIKNNTLINIR